MLFRYSLYQLLFLFLIYSHLGWCVEVIYAAGVRGKFINRGFCTGPVCPIYGVGAISVLIFLEPIKEYWWLLFLESVIFTSFIEFAGGYILEKFFHEKWWDYSNEPFNLKGYICLRFSLLWGIACVLAVRVIHPTIMTLLRLIPDFAGYISVAFFLVVFFSDFTFTVVTMMKLRSNLLSIIDIEDHLHEWSVSLGTSLSEKTLEFERFKDDISDNEDIEKIRTFLAEMINENIDDMAENFEDKKEEFTELYEKLMANIESSKKRIRRIENAFPHITSGKYHHIFK